MSDVRIEGLNVENALALAARLRERADGLPQDAEDPDNIMSDFTHQTKCGTVGCIAGEYGIWKNCDWSKLGPFIGVPWESEDDTISHVIYLSDWLSSTHRIQFLERHLTHQRLRVMASYLTWLAGEGA